MSFLPALGIASYNGFTFNGTTRTEAVEITPAFDTAGRTVVYNVYRITLKTVLAAQPTDALVLDARRRLTKPGAAFTYTGRGFGDISINVSGPRDVNWGPKPQLLSLTPHGRGNATTLVWRVEVAIPDCAAARYAFKPMEFNFRVNYSIDKAGYTRRTYAGFVRIPPGRGANQRTLSDSPDNYREQIAPELIAGFRRTAQDFVIDEAKTRLDFSVTDEEMPDRAPPPGIVEASADHQVGASMEAGGLRFWTGQLTAQYELAPGLGPNGFALAARAFTGLALDRIGHAMRQVALDKSKAAVIPVAVSIREPDLYGRPKAAFSYTYTFGSRLRDVIADAGLWRPVPDSKWSFWAASMEGVLGPWGNARLTFTPGDDEVVDLCGGTARPPGDARRPQRRVIFSELRPRPTPNNSWIAYENYIRVEVEQGTAELRTLPQATLPIQPPQSGTLVKAEKPKPAARTPVSGALVPILSAPGAAAGGGGLIGAIRSPRGAFNKVETDGSQIVIGKAAGTLVNDMVAPKDQPPVSVQNRAAPLVHVYMIGKALRAGFEIPCPQLTDVNGAKPVACNRPDRGEGFTQGIVTNAGVPVFAAKWNLRYVLKEVPPGGVPVPPNPMLQG